MGVCVIVITALLLFTLSQDVASYPMQDSSAPLPNEQMVKGVITPNMDTRMRLYLLSWLQNLGALSNERIKAKRTCLLNAGLSHSCDYKDALAAIDEGMYLGSDNTPGKK